MNPNHRAPVSFPRQEDMTAMTLLSFVFSLVGTSSRIKARSSMIQGLCDFLIDSKQIEWTSSLCHTIVIMRTAKLLSSCEEHQRRIKHMVRRDRFPLQTGQLGICHSLKSFSLLKGSCLRIVSNDRLACTWYEKPPHLL
ncbi:hypothetical protein Tco_0428410 [Tanacetum coccineum]